jgi:hypothetical protein
MHSLTQGAGQHAATRAICGILGGSSKARAHEALGKPTRSEFGWGAAAQSHFLRRHSNATVRRSKQQRTNCAAVAGCKRGLGEGCREIRVRVLAGQLRTGVQAWGLILAAAVAHLRFLPFRRRRNRQNGRVSNKWQAKRRGCLRESWPPCSTSQGERNGPRRLIPPAKGARR